MPVTTQFIAIGKWANRASLNYVPVNTAINGKYYNSFGLEITHPLADTQRRPYQVDNQGSTAYIAYDSDELADVVIYKIQEV